MTAADRHVRATVVPDPGSHGHPPASPPGRPARGRRRWIAVAAIVALGLVAAVTVGRDRRAVDIAVVDPPTASLEELVSRADLVVVGRIVEVAPGRVLSDPDDPARAVRTRLSQLEVDEVTVGSGAARLVLEEVGALADGTPATVGGLRASRVGDAGLYLLVRGDGGRVALVGPQGRYLLDADDPDRLRAPDGGDPLVVRLAGLGPRRLRRAVLEAAGSAVSGRAGARSSTR